MPHLQVLAASCGEGVSSYLNFYCEQLRAAAALWQSTLRELWLLNTQPVDFVWAEADAQGLTRILPDFFDAYPHLHFIHCSSSADITLPTGGTPKLLPCETRPPVMDASRRRIQMHVPAASLPDSGHWRYVRDL